MIKLKKIEIPLSLKEHKDQWTKELMDYVDRGEKVPDNIKNKYNQADVKEQLRTETNGKCMYCESFIGAIAYEHIEHFKPKSKYPHLTFEWSNLGLACPKCNTNKLNDFDENCPFINPYIDNPNDHFVAAGTMILSKPNDKRAKITELTLDLNRPELLEARKERINSIRSLVDQYISETNAFLKDLLLKEIQKESSGDKPYSMCVKSVVNQLI